MVTLGQYDPQVHSHDNILTMMTLTLLGMMMLLVVMMLVGMMMLLGMMMLVGMMMLLVVTQM